MFNLILPLTFLLFQIIIPTSKAYDYFTNCTNSPTYTNNSTYQTNLNNLLSNLLSQSSISGFYKTSVGQNPNQIYGLYLCRGDMDSQGCSECVYQAHNMILQQCPDQIWAVIWFNNCMLRFSNVSFFNRLNLALSTVVYNPQNMTIDENRALVDALNKTMTDFPPQVANSMIKYGTKEANVTSSQKLYTLGQCTLDLTPDDCDRCLRVAIGQLPHNPGGKVLQLSCNVRFEVSSFYSDFVNWSFFLPATTNSTSKRNREKSSHIVVEVSISVVFAVLLLITTTLCCIQKHRNSVPSPDLEEISSSEFLQFRFKEIRVATNNFSLDNKLGEGGFGAVYKGMLKNGQEIAVKRLSTNSGQGIKEFKTEVLLVAKLQHKNLVRLLGFCLRANEKLLVYELLPNSSLDKVLLDPNKQSPDWETRYKIIVGIARGLLYLHEDSRLKIIHRDLKPSNILLAQSMEPKISDFGLARLVGTEQIQADTNRIVGTYGYMAPEYAMTGRFSAKSDVYSFGVIVLEIVSGHKCSSTVFPFDEESLPEQAWRLWSFKAALELVDSRLDGNFSSEEVSRCVHIALLCIQEDVNRRPTMAPIVSSLSGHPVALSVPTPPHLVSTITTTTSAQTSNTFSANRDITQLHPR